jgi:hypothetical protein
MGATALNLDEACDHAGRAAANGTYSRSVHSVVTGWRAGCWQVRVIGPKSKHSMVKRPRSAASVRVDGGSTTQLTRSWAYTSGAAPS